MSYPYQPFYCEENIWRLCRLNPFDGEEVYAAVISNHDRACPLWNQRACPSPSRPIFWDYHVVAIECGAAETRVWDLDSRLDAPVPIDLWWRATFPLLERLDAAFSPFFRVVSRDAYLATFSSDRSHMLGEGGEYKKPPPEWEPIFDPDVGMNLEQFLEMGRPFVGDLHGADGFRARFRA